jgi:hypothetical protein
MITISIETLRELFISYQSQFYNENEMYDLIAQSDQNRAIKAGDYDDHIMETFAIKNGGLSKKK